MSLSASVVRAARGAAWPALGAARPSLGGATPTLEAASPANASVRGCRKLLDTLDQVTGIQKRELLAALAGDCDPFRMLSIKRGPGTKARPNLIPSAFDKRILACNCHPDNNHLEFMYLHMGEPKRCYCGYWFELCPVAPL